MKKVSLIFTGILITFLNANDVNDIESSIKEIEQLKKENKILLEKLNKIEKKLKSYHKKTQKQINELYSRADENELESSLNKIKWGGELITRVGNFYGKSMGQKFTNTNKWDMQLRLTMDAKINEKTKFTGRLVMTKAWANVNPMYQNYVDPMSGRADGTNAIFVERAYVDYKVTPKFIVTVGRQPSSDGPGLSLKYDTPRKSTYPALLFNGQADGVVLTYKIKKNLKTRFAYGKGYQWNDKNFGWVAKNPGIEDMNVYGYFLEGNIDNEKLGKNLWILSAVRTTDLTSNPFDDANATANTSLGNYTHLGLYFENYHPLNSKFNYFISLAYANPDGNGKTGFLDINGDGKLEPVKLLKQSGYAYDLGVRYDIKNNIKIGYEFNYGSKYWFSFSGNLMDPVNKLAVRGKVNDLYLIYNMDLFQLLRVGFTYVDYDYTGSGMYLDINGEPQKTDDYYRLLYMTYDVRF